MVTARFRWELPNYCHYLLLRRKDVVWHSAQLCDFNTKKKTSSRDQHDKRRLLEIRIFLLHSPLPAKPPGDVGVIHHHLVLGASLVEKLAQAIEGGVAAAGTGYSVGSGGDHVRCRHSATNNKTN